MKELAELAVRSFHYRHSLDSCMNAIAHLDSYTRAQTTKKDTPIKVRQDLLATHEVIALAMGLRRFAEVTRTTKVLNGVGLAAHVLAPVEGRGKLSTSNVPLKDVVGQIIHSDTCVVCRDVFRVCSHFDVNVVPRALIDSEYGTKAVLVIKSDRPKRFFFLEDFLKRSWSVIGAFSDRNEEVKAYLTRRHF